MVGILVQAAVFSPQIACHEHDLPPCEIDGQDMAIFFGEGQHNGLSSFGRVAAAGLPNQVLFQQTRYDGRNGGFRQTQEAGKFGPGYGIMLDDGFQDQAGIQISDHFLLSCFHNLYTS